MTLEQPECILFISLYIKLHSCYKVTGSYVNLRVAADIHIFALLVLCIAQERPQRPHASLHGAFMPE